MITRSLIKFIIWMCVFFMAVFPLNSSTYIEDLKVQIDSITRELHLSEDQNKASYLNQLADLCRDIDYHKTILFADSALIYAERFNLGKEKVKAFRMLAYGHYFTNNQDEAVEYIEKAKKLAEKIDWYAGLGYIYWDIGRIYYQDDDYQTAIDYFDQSIDIFREGNEVEGLFKALYFKGEVFHDQSKYDEALECYLEISRKANDHPAGDKRFCVFMGDVYFNISSVYDIMKNEKKTTESLNNAEIWYKKADDPLGQAEILIKLSRHYNDQDNIREAAEKLLLAEKIARSTENNELQMVINNQLGELYFEKNDFTKAIEILVPVYAFYDTNDRPWEKTNVASKIVEAMIERGDFGRAEFYLDQILQYASSTRSIDFYEDYYFNKYKTAKASKDLVQALDYYIKYSDYKDSVLNRDNFRQIAEIQIKYETAERENQIFDLNRDLETQKKNRTLLYLSTVMLIVLLGAAGWILKMKNDSLRKTRILQKQENELHKVKLEKIKAERLHAEQKVFAERQINKLQRQSHTNELELKNSELNHLTATLINKNSALKSIKNIMKNNSNALDKNKIVNELYSLIISNIDPSHNWYVLKQSFQKADSGFFDRLRSKYHVLTENDHMLCAYLKMKLTTKEIANLLNISEVSVSKRRNRLRKKINLDPQFDLCEWLKSV